MINLDTIGEFTWGFGRNFLIEVDGKYYQWSCPDYGGDHSITPYLGDTKNFAGCGFMGRDKGKHRVGDFCGPDVRIIL